MKKLTFINIMGRYFIIYGIGYISLYGIESLILNEPLRNIVKVMSLGFILAGSTLCLGNKYIHRKRSNP